MQEQLLPCACRLVLDLPAQSHTQPAPHATTPAALDARTPTHCVPTSRPDRQHTPQQLAHVSSRGHYVLVVLPQGVNGTTCVRRGGGGPATCGGPHQSAASTATYKHHTCLWGLVRLGQSMPSTSAPRMLCALFKARRQAGRPATRQAGREGRRAGRCRQSSKTGTVQHAPAGMPR